MARDHDMERRLLNWARWALAKGGGVNGVASVNWDKLADGDTGRSGYITATVPIEGIEASETHDAIKRLPSELRATVECHYLGNGTVREKLARLHCSERLLYHRIERAHRLLGEHFAAQLDKRLAERRRVQALADGMRPR